MINLNFDVKKSILKNGLEILTVKKNTQIATINIGVKVGSMYEEINEKGISHFIEHMLFKGTKNLDNEELNDKLESLGGEYNAYTDYDSTVYTISCLNEEFVNAVELLGDMITSSTFNKDELEKERGVILAEIRSGRDDVEDLSFKKVNEVAYKNSPLKYDVTGCEERVNKFNRQEIVEFYNKYYIPNNSIVTLVSSMEHSDAVELIKKNFGTWEKGNDINQINIVDENIETVVTSYKNDIEQSSIIYLYTFNSITKEEELPLKILNHRLGESTNSLLFREIREKRGLAYEIYTHLDLTKNIKVLYIYTAVAKEAINETIEAIDETIANVINGKIVFGDKDLEIMKKVHKTAVITTIEDSAELCNYLLHQQIDGSDLFEFLNDMNELNYLNKERINNVAKEVLCNPTVHILTTRED